MGVEKSHTVPAPSRHDVSKLAVLTDTPRFARLPLRTTTEQARSGAAGRSLEWSRFGCQSVVPRARARHGHQHVEGRNGDQPSALPGRDRRCGTSALFESLGLSLRPQRGLRGGGATQRGTITTTICPFCGVGCGQIVEVRDGRVVNIEGDPDHPINEGSVCSKGAALYQVARERAAPPEDPVPEARREGVGGTLLGPCDPDDRRAGEEDPRRHVGRAAGRPHAQSHHRASPAWAGRLSTPRSATCSPRPCGRSGSSGWSIRPGYDTAPRWPVWPPHSAVGR
jgi:hypothetical protein